MRELMRGLLRIKVRPYYLFHCDPVTGAGHFRTSVWKGIEIVEGLRGHVSGLGVPTYVIDGLHGAGKIPVMPNYLISASDDAVVLRNYEGMIFRYAPDDKPPTARPVESTGVSHVLSGGGKPLVPAGNPRLDRRKKKLLAANGRKPKLDVAEAPAASPASRPLAGDRATNGKAVVVAATGKSNGSRVSIAATAVRFDGDSEKSLCSPERVARPDRAAKATNGKTDSAKSALAAKKRG
jgi:lysine 2,3-aminomutase